ncbi:MAG: DUF2075 domain-containing protein [Phycisphaeraceae bacterium]|nr:DUF2075 domain-containing protein [Phycisphaeraceae bacterium]
MGVNQAEYSDVPTSSRWFYRDTIARFISSDEVTVLGVLTKNCGFSVETTQSDAWIAEFRLLRNALSACTGEIFLEYSIPRMGRRVDVVLLIGAVVFVVEFKINSHEYRRSDLEQVWDYALDLKNFHKASHNHFVAPILVATQAPPKLLQVAVTHHRDRTLFPICSNADNFAAAVKSVVQFADDAPIDPAAWASGSYCPTPTIIEAATALYNHHSVEDISRNDAGAINLRQTSQCIAEVIRRSRDGSRKSICFVTGVPGAGKTLVGLNIATTHYDKDSDLYSVFLSGNGPLVKVLREALVRDKVKRTKGHGKRMTKSDARSEVKMFIQNVHNFRDDCLVDDGRPPVEHVALFDEAQRAWNHHQTAAFMARKKKRPGFSMSEPEFLISCLDRHPDWAVVVCLVGGGQEINTGEAGIGEWINSLQASYPHWDIWLSEHLTDSEYGAGDVLKELKDRPGVRYVDDLHLAVSLRSYRAEHVSLFVKQVLDLEANAASTTLQQLSEYPIVITRDIAKAKQWLRNKARGSERYCMGVSSQAERLKPYAIDIRPEIDPVHWFLNDKDDVRSSYYLEDVATEFHIQGLELDWTCVTWDADLRYSTSGWQYKSFHGNRWKNIKSIDRRRYLKNAYRVLLTRARQGMVIVVPHGDRDDPTRLPAYYDATYEYLCTVGLRQLDELA